MLTLSSRNWKKTSTRYSLSCMPQSTAMSLDEFGRTALPQRWQEKWLHSSVCQNVDSCKTAAVLTKRRSCSRLSHRSCLWVMCCPWAAQQHIRRRYVTASSWVSTVSTTLPVWAVHCQLTDCHEPWQLAM